MLVINGSARINGNTSQVCDLLTAQYGGQVINLAEKELHEFTYEGPGEDDFEAIVTQMIQNKKVVWVTPIYWYTMSGQMKNFLDRFTDLLKWKKELGRELRGLEMKVISSSEHDDAPEHFKYPFVLSADYLGMEFKGYIHTWIVDNKVTSESKIRIENLIRS